RVEPATYLAVNWPSPQVFTEADKGESWRVEVRAVIKDPAHPESPERQSNNSASATFQVQNPISDIGVGFVCVTDSLKYRCLDRVFPGQSWHVLFSVFNKGERPILNWSY